MNEYCRYSRCNSNHWRGIALSITIFTFEIIWRNCSND
nr:MAG TPA_asm: hypothetical protein [Caudoviricetes sp.]